MPCAVGTRSGRAAWTSASSRRSCAAGCGRISCGTRLLAAASRRDHGDRASTAGPHQAIARPGARSRRDFGSSCSLDRVAAIATLEPRLAAESVLLHRAERPQARGWYIVAPAMRVHPGGSADLLMMAAVSPNRSIVASRSAVRPLSRKRSDGGRAQRTLVRSTGAPAPLLQAGGRGGRQGRVPGQGCGSPGGSAIGRLTRKARRPVAPAC